VSLPALLILTVAAGLATTKLLDCWSTARKIERAAQEANPITRWMMARAGPQQTIWLVFALALGIIAVSTWWVLDFVADTEGHPAWLRWAVGGGFVIYGVFVSLVQAAVAHANHTGRHNPLTDRILSVYARLKRR
jgi:hypothetical protein